MASAWGNSWSTAWGDAWGSTGAQPPAVVVEQAHDGGDGFITTIVHAKEPKRDEPKRIERKREPEKAPVVAKREKPTERIRNRALEEARNKAEQARVQAEGAAAQTLAAVEAAAGVVAGAAILNAAIQAQYDMEAATLLLLTVE